MHSHGMWLGLLLAGAVAAPTGAAQAPGDEAAVRQLIAAQVEAWNRGDARAHAADCRDDVLFTNVLGATYDTRTAFEERQAVIFGDELTLITDSDGEAWAQAVVAAASRHVRTLIEGRDFSDVEGHWAAVREIGRGGAILVRPDQHVAWYACAPTSDATTRLSAAVAAVACH